MNKLLLTFFTASQLLISCNSDEPKTDNAELENLKAENSILKRELAEKDETVNNYLSYINEVRENLALIKDKQQHLGQLRANNPELNLQENDIVEDIKAINELRLKNLATINSLKKELGTKSNENSELNKLILSLSEEIAVKDREIYNLQMELETANAAFSQLFESYTEQQEMLDEQTSEINKAYYALGTSKELQENNVITKEGGFVGIGKSKKIKSDFNQKYFTEIDITKISEITINHKKADLITTHPAGSFEIVNEDGMVKKLVIKDAKKFWSVSKYVVIVVG
jgi:chromosome segregation ATPase